jgi:hypothetical protein
MTRYRTWTVLHLLATASIVLARSVHAQEAPEVLLKRVTTIYQANKDAINNVEFNYENSVNSLHYVARYARSGEKQYHAALRDTLRGGIIMPRELAFDGSLVYERERFGVLAESLDKARFKMSCPVPDEAVGAAFEAAAGIRKSMSWSYVFVSAKVLAYQGRAAIELVFRDDSHHVTFTSIHAQDVAYSPIARETRQDDGLVIGEMSSVRYAKRVSGGNEIYYPVFALMKARKSEAEVNVESYTVDENSLHVNEPIPPSRFVLSPWPNEKVVNYEAKTSLPAKDATWQPAGRVSFPFDKYAMLLEARRSDADAAVARETLPLPQRTSTLSRAGTWAIWGGITTLVLTAAGVWLRRRGLV